MVLSLEEIAPSFGMLPKALDGDKFSLLQDIVVKIEEILFNTHSNKHYVLMCLYIRVLPNVIKSLDELPAGDICKQVIPALKKCMLKVDEILRIEQDDEFEDEDVNSEGGDSSNNSHTEELVNLK